MMIEERINKIKELNLVDAFQFLIDENKGKVVFTTSFGIEDQVVTDIIARNNLDVAIVTLDTGRLFQETYKVFQRSIEKYDISIKTYFPKNKEVENLMTTKGPNSFYQSIENRKECCYIRKVEPLQRALKDQQIWVTGLRSEQSSAREALPILQMDKGFNIAKFNPLYNWTLDDVWNYIRKNNVPYNVLHDKGFISIGCEPCTRAIKEGEDFRAGRWWWESNSKKECGLHTQG